MHQNKGAIHHPFPGPCRRETLANYFDHALQGNKERGGSPGCCHIAAECWQVISEQSVRLNKIKYGGQN